MAKRKKTALRPANKRVEGTKTRFTTKQGQYLAYIHLYRKLHRRGPSEGEIAEYFEVSPPSVHQMIVKLEEKGLVIRQPGVPRSVRVAIPKTQIPDLEEDSEQEAAMPVFQEDGSQSEPTTLYTLHVFLIDGPVPEKFAGKEISRQIQIRGDQTLEDLHRTIFQAFDRWDDHFYEFQFGKGPHDVNGKRYVLPEMVDQTGPGPEIAGNVDHTTIDSLGLKVNQPFGYWFDYGDDWWHQIDVTAIAKKVPMGQYPRVVKRIGKSPPQYMDEH